MTFGEFQVSAKHWRLNEAEFVFLDAARATDRAMACDLIRNFLEQVAVLSQAHPVSLDVMAADLDKERRNAYENRVQAH